ncbi:MAG: ChaN family lipoprotein, partial [Deltaproteobacteria bacterium]|nr:ChaN family lipoprotein [Deltaproteobacteria bacterium]
MTAREELHSLQEALFRRQKRLIAASVHGMTAAFKRYEAAYQRRVRTFAREATYGEVLHAVSTADLVYVGDYHTLKQAQRSFLKLMRRRWPRRELIIALEFVQGRHQRVLDQYMAGKLSEAGFLAGIEYERHLVFDVWPHFKPLLEEARAQKVKVIGIDLMGTAATTLAMRDAFAARKIAQAVMQNPGAQVFALAGQLHVAPPHLPAAVAKELARHGMHLPSVSVYQNCEDIWFALQARGRELEVEAALVRPGEWCLLNTPPVVVQQSYLDWIEGGPEPLEGTHPEQRFKELALLVARGLGLDGKAVRQALTQVQVWTAGDLTFLDALPQRGFSQKEIRQIERQILSRESYYIPRAKLAYLANLSVNHAAEEAAHFLRHVVSGATDEPRPLIDGFYARALEEAYAFCGSKIVNPRRKCAHEADFKRLSRRAADPFTRDVARLVLLHGRIERGEAHPNSLRAL